MDQITNNKYKISVVVPVYNAEKYLRECLDTILAQTLRDFEVICVDDGSTDESLSILKEYEEKVQVKSPSRREDESIHSSTSTSNFDSSSTSNFDLKFKVISCEHTNAGHCRNVGIAQSHGEYLMFLDADDLFAPTLLETLLSAALKTNADVAICEHVDFNDGDDTKGLFAQTKTVTPKMYHEPSKNIDIYHWQGWPWDKLIARRIIDKYALSFQEQRTTNDVFFILTALSVAETIVECPTPLMAYRRNIRGSLTATRNKSPRCFYDALVGYYDKMCALGIFPGNENLLMNFRAYSCDQSFWQFDSVSGSEAAKITFPLLKDLCVRWNWCEAVERDVSHPLLYPRCQSLMRASDALEAYRSDICFLAKAYAELIEIKRSHTYRFAQLLVRWIRRLFM